MGDASLTIRDPLWQNVTLDAAAAAVVDTPEFQRLRRVKQLGFAHLVYPGAVHNRFLHALGPDGLPMANEIRLDMNVVLFTVLITAVSTA